MTEKSGKFLGGFVFGTIIGSALGILLGSRLNQLLEGAAESSETNDLATAEEVSVGAKQNLEQKIAQLNAAIDAVSRELTATEPHNKP